MLTYAELQRIETSILDLDFGIDWETTTLTPDISFVWSGSDSVDPDFTDYPAIVANDESLGETNDSMDPLNNLVSREIADDEMTETREQPELDSLQLTVAVGTHHQDGVPPQVRLKQLTRTLWRWVQFEANRQLNNEGTDGERPLVVIPSSPPTFAREERSLRNVLAVQLQHTEWEERELDYAEGFDVTMT